MRIRTVLLTLVAVAILAPSVAQAGKKKAAEKEAALPTTMAQVQDTVVDTATQDPQRKAAEAYLNALAGTGSDQGRDLLLGGATMTARIFQLENWKVVSREKHRNEVGQLADLNALVDGLDREARTALSKLMGGGPGSEDDMSTHEFSADEAKKILEPTKKIAAQFNKTHPVFAYIARVDKEVYFHPKNPFRDMLAKAGANGKYTLELDLFWIETDEGLGENKTARKWPLRVLRFVSDKVDTGYKILPASDWNAE